MAFTDALGALEAEGFELIGAFGHKGERGGEMLLLPLGLHGQVQGVAQVFPSLSVFSSKTLLILPIAAFALAREY